MGPCSSVSLIVDVFHAYNIVGESQVQRNLSPMIFIIDSREHFKYHLKNWL